MLLQRFDVRVLLWVLAAALWLTPATNGAGLQLFLGDSDWAVQGLVEDERFGQFAYPAGDVNGDGYQDILISSQYANDPAGGAWLYYGGPSGPGPTPDVTFTSPPGMSSSHYFGMHARTAGDVNGDGYDDVMIGCTGCDAPGGSPDEGMVFFYYGADGGIDTTYDWRARGVALYAHLGWALAPAGDVNGDGYDDVLVGAYRYDWNSVDSIHHAYLFFGSDSGLDSSGSRSEGTPANCDWSARGEQALDGFGLILGSAGDLNDDGYDELFIGAQGWDNGAQADAGKVWLWYGSDTGPTSPGSPSTADWSAQGAMQNDRFGGAGGYDAGVAGVGDVDGDGYDDLLIGCYACDVGGTDNGMAGLWYGSDSGLTAGPPDWQIAGGHDSDILGFSVDAAGDFNQDGYADLLISQPRWDPIWDPNNHTDMGRVGLWLGSAAGPQSEPLPIYADCLMAGDQEESLFGLSVAGVGDVDKDGFDDLLLASEYCDTNDDGDTVDDQGKVFLFRGQGLISADDFESADWLRWSEARQ